MLVGHPDNNYNVKQNKHHKSIIYSNHDEPCQSGFTRPTWFVLFIGIYSLKTFVSRLYVVAVPWYNRQLDQLNNMPVIWHHGFKATMDRRRKSDYYPIPAW